jgi:hypothetical protein
MQESDFYMTDKHISLMGDYAEKLGYFTGITELHLML